MGIKYPNTNIKAIIKARETNNELTAAPVRVTDRVNTIIWINKKIKIIMVAVLSMALAWECPSLGWKKLI